ncbi:putative type II secretion system protein HxcR [Phycisphaerales bacterium]|nr:putative type II secretion system protein HxcR [Phycisphaerales bacterium]
MTALADAAVIEPKPANPAAPLTADPSLEFLSLIPHDFARRHLVLSRGQHNGVEYLAISDRTSAAVAFNVGVRLARAVHSEIAPGEEIAAAIDRAYAAASNTASGAEQARASRDDDPVELAIADGEQADVQAALRSAEADLLHTSGKAPMVRLVDLLLFEALQRSASDVHIQPVSDRVIVRYRLDGVLHVVREMPAAALPAIVSRVKVMARLDVAEQRAPQDGRATVTLGGARRPHESRRIDLRISTLPTTYGERVVIRILDAARSAGLLRFAALGMPADVERAYLAQASRTNGIVLVTGPTGSGKTTTLYATLAWITQTKTAGDAPSVARSPNASPLATSCSLNILTIEDPVEYDLATSGLAISQTQLNVKKGVTFAAGLRHILRQDPDVIMVGEVRDEETARIAVQASLTGHLVLSTLHTNDAPSAVARLLDLGVEPFLVSSSLAAVLAQRLVRTLHLDCAGAGCAACLHTGFQGRTGLFELLVLDQALRDQVAKHTSAQVIRSLAIGKGMTTLTEAGRRLISQGRTTAAEVARVIEGVE